MADLIIRSGLQKRQATKRKRATELLYLLDTMLNDTEIEIISRRRALDGYPQGESQTLQSVAREMGATKERIRQIEERIIHKLRRVPKC